MMVGSNILLMHTVGGAAQAAVSAILVRALILLKRNGQIPKGFISIAVLISLAGLARTARLTYTWLEPPSPLWLDALTVIVLFVAIFTIPIILSSHYLPASDASGHRIGWASWLRLAMTVNAVLGLLAFILAIVFRHGRLLPLICCIAFTICAALLIVHASLARNLQLRQRSLVLFAILTTMGLLGISANLFVGFLGVSWHVTPKRLGIALEASTASIEFSNMLIMLGMMFVFASLRLADIIVKRVVAMYIWCVASLSMWGVATIFFSKLNGRIVWDAGLSFLAVTFIGLEIWLTPLFIRKMNGWIDRWVFEVPDFNSTIQRFWEQLLEYDSVGAVCHAGEEIIRSTLSLAEVRVVTQSTVRPLEKTPPPFGPNPYFIPKESPLRSIFSPPADLILPLTGEGGTDYWIILSHGVIRPPLTSMELNFVSRITAEIQIRISAVLAEKRRSERLQRERDFREEIANAELRALRAQINPHFLFNSLNTIADLSIVDPEKAEKMTLRLSAVFRYVLVNADKQFICISEELDFARSYLDIEEARFEDRLRVQFDVEPAVLQERIPTLLLQPLIENALKHGISSKMQGGTLSISARRTNTGLELTVSDDGAGLRPDAKKDVSDRNTHVGLRNIEKRLQIAYGELATFTLKPRDGGGVEATIVIRKKTGDLL